MSAETSWTQPSPIGPLRVVVGGRGVTAIHFGAHADRGGPAPDEEVAKRLVAYFGGDLAALEPVEVDLRSVAATRRRVYEELRAVPAGAVVSYGELGRMAGLEGPYAARAVGQAMAANPVPLAVPCHRVVAADGTLGGFGAGLDTKRWLLAHEGVAPRAGGWVSRRPMAPTLFSADD